ncbi:hypothetical protein OG921_24470 [Aldersonia sp. NBC_00410]|uniref:hypothetical protein n=1 Tax=Aldersonia sp. NBC_00410 TaxID=2975954 RepID=UPI002257CD15|nr:hypothetical protein [Aldersonia sp. NBC_00410]MCX5044845.1 hypothetical protein [Aldersonia sp. NBC_00410]MCX5046332.1 hypothetical protein [Aldersonia sp. NBC_00410]
MGTALLSVIALIGIGALLDQLMLHFERHAWIRWRKTTTSTGAGAAGMFGEMQNLFAPSNRHVVEEIAHKQIVRAESTTVDDVDLTGGTVRITRPKDG